MRDTTGLIKNLILFFNRRNAVLDITYSTYFVRGLKQYLVDYNLKTNSLVITTKFLEEFLETTGERIKKLIKAGLETEDPEERKEILEKVTALKKVYEEKVIKLEELAEYASRLSSKN